MDILKDIQESRMSRFQIRAVAVATVIMVVDGIDVAIAAYAAPAISRAWALDPVTLGFLLSAGLVGMAIGSLFLTPFSDRIGRRRLTLVGLLIATVGMLLSVFAADVYQLMAFRVLAGIGIGGLIANNIVFASEYASDKRRGTVFGIYTMGFPIGATLGGLLANPLIPLFGWRSVFVVCGLLTGLILLISWRILPESLDYLLSRRPANALRDVNIIMTKMGRPSLSELPVASKADQSRGRAKELFTGRMAARTILLWLGYGLAIASYYFATSWTPKLMAAETGDDSLGVMMGVIINFGGILGGVLFSVVAIFLKLRRILLISLIVSAATYVVFGLVFQTGSTAVAIGFALGVITSMNMCGFNGAGPTIFPASLRGTGVGWMTGIGRLVSIVSPIFVGFLLSAQWPAEHIYILFAVPLLLSAGAMFVVWKLTDSKSTTADQPPSVVDPIERPGLQSTF